MSTAKKTETKAKKTKAKAPKDKKPKSKPTAKAKPKARATKEKFLHDDGRLELPNGRMIPAPKKVSEEKMQKALARLNLNLPFPVQVGMTLVKHYRSEPSGEIRIDADGFTYAGNTYSSLSTAAAWMEHRGVSGNDVFNFAKHKNIEIRGKGVPGKVYKKPEPTKASEEQAA